MKKCITAILGVILMISLAGCGAVGHHDVHKEIYKRYYSPKSYYAEAELTITNDRSRNVYHVRQFYLAPDKYSVVVDSPENVAGSGYVFKDGTVLLKSGFGKNEKLPCTPDGRSSSCLADFFAEYYKSEEASVSVSGGVVNEPETVMSCQLSGKKTNMFSQKLWINNETFLPVKLETYDADNNAVVTVTYNEFKLNCDLDDSFFE